LIGIHRYLIIFFSYSISNTGARNAEHRASQANAHDGSQAFHPPCLTANLPAMARMSAYH
jgi:hypothetical protein